MLCWNGGWEKNRCVINERGGGRGEGVQRSTKEEQTTTPTGPNETVRVARDESFDVIV